MSVCFGVILFFISVATRFVISAAAVDSLESPVSKIIFVFYVLSRMLNSPVPCDRSLAVVSPPALLLLVAIYMQFRHHLKAYMFD